MKCPRTCAFVALAAAAAAAGARAAMMCEQSITLQPGWNAFYLTVNPTQDAERVFADWPVDSVGRYDAASFSRSAQFSSSGSTEGATSASVSLWSRTAPAASTWSALVANAVYLAFSTSSVPFSVRIAGVPQAARLSWHAADGGSASAVLNYVGLSLADGASVTPASYFAGFPGYVELPHAIYGDNAAAPETGLLYGTETFSHGSALAMASSTVSDWSGPLYVSPEFGIDLSTNVSSSSVSVRNDGASNCLVRVTIEPSLASSGEEFSPSSTNFYIRSLSVAGDWQPFGPEWPFECRLGAGETLALKIALDRTSLARVAGGSEVGGILRISDVDGGTGFSTAIPISATVGSADDNVWPTGLWICEATLDKVSYVGASGDISSPVPAGGSMKVRLPVSVAADGSMTLLPRVDLSPTRRFSAPCLPQDRESIAGSGNFGTTASFGFTVGEKSRVNPMLHARHPDHDGLDSSFSKEAPSGDNLDNYLGTVKPELFSIDNVITLTWGGDAREAASWNPQNTLTGTCEWALKNVRREGAIRSSGSFTMTLVR